MNDRDYTRMKKAELLTTPGCPEGSDDAFDLVEALERLAEGRAVELQVFRQHVRHQAASNRPPLVDREAADPAANRTRHAESRR